MKSGIERVARAWSLTVWTEPSAIEEGGKIDSDGFDLVNTGGRPGHADIAVIGVGVISPGIDGCVGVAVVKDSRGIDVGIVVGCAEGGIDGGVDSDDCGTVRSDIDRISGS